MCGFFLFIAFIFRSNFQPRGGRIFLVMRYAWPFLTNLVTYQFFPWAVLFISMFKQDSSEWKKTLLMQCLLPLAETLFSHRQKTGPVVRERHSIVWAANITVTSFWVRWRRKSPTSRWVAQPFVWRVTISWRTCVVDKQIQSNSINRLFGRRSKKTSKLRTTGLCEGNPPVTSEQDKEFTTPCLW